MAVIGFIGLGNMGFPMACRLKEAGHEVRCFDVSAGSMERAHDAGLQRRASVDEAVAGAEVVITMLPSGRHVLDVLAARALPFAPGALVIDCSTIDVASCATFHESAAGARGSPRSTRPSPAASAAPPRGRSPSWWAARKPPSRARSNSCARWARTSFTPARPAQDRPRRSATTCSPAFPCWRCPKRCTWRKRLGLDARKFFEIASTSSGQCWALTSYAPEPGLVPSAPANRGYEGGFASELMLKDLRLAEQAAVASHSPALLGAAAASVYAMHCAAGRGRLDFSSIIQMLGAAQPAHP